MFKITSSTCFISGSIISVLILTSILASLAASTELVGEDGKPVQVPKIFNYGDYVEKFKKSYTKLETIDKARIFFGRTMNIFKHNVLYLKNKVNYFLSQNEFTDITSHELKSRYFSDEPPMKPVLEALKNPDAPANLFENPSAPTPSESKSAISDNKLTETEKPLKRISEKNIVNDHPTIVKKTVNFLDDQNVDDLSEMLEKIRSNPEVAEQMGVVVDLRVDEKEKSNHQPEKSQIEYRPIVDSNNKHYDPQMITSYGLFSVDQMFENFAEHLMQEGGLSLEPYPEPITPKPVPAPQKRSTLSSLLHSVQNVFDFMAYNEYDYSDYNDEEEENDKEEEVPKEPVKEPIDLQKNKKSSGPQYDIDWRGTGCITKPHSQLFCNSCYAFATLGVMEYFYCKHSKKLTSFSPQYVVDCGANLSVGGCRGGKISSVGGFINKYGLELESLYPYNGRENQCPYSDEDERQKKPGYIRPHITHWQMFQEMAAWGKWIKKSPIIVGINMPTDFLAYGGGIHDGLDCTQEMVHALLLVGSGSQDGKDFWLLKNSFAESWGEAGYFRLSKSAPLRCFNAATVVRADFSSSENI